MERAQATGMTLKQYHKARYLRLVEKYQESKDHLHTAAGRAAFILLSVQVHAAKAHVPKSWWRLAR
jgi:hypothetical protein